MKLSTFLKYRKGKSVRIKASGDIDLLPILTPEYLRNNSEPEFTSPVNNVVVGNDEIILLWDGSNAGEFFWSKKGVLASTMVVLDFDRSRFNLDYLYYSFKHFEPWLKTQTRGSGIPHVDKDILLRHKIQELDKKEQAKIAEVLSTIDHAITQTEALIAKHLRIKTGLMQVLLTRGIDEHGQLRDLSTHRFKSTPLGMIPEEWEVKELQECTKSTITYGIVQAGPHIIGGVPYIRSGDMMGEALSKENLLCTSPEIASRFKRSEVKAGEIVMSIRASVGQVLLVPKELDGANLTQGTARIAPKEKIHNGFLLWSIRSHRTQTEIDASTKGTTFKEISLSTLRKVPVVMPASFDEHKQIALILEKQVAQIRTLNISLDKLRSLKTGLMQDLLSGRVSVKVLMDMEGI